MREGHIAIYYGKGKGKTSIAVGRGMRAIGEDLRVVMIQFMDYHNSKETALLKKMEPDFRGCTGCGGFDCRRPVLEPDAESAG